ncbi:MAG: FixH family protein [Sphingomonadales bacterium]|nr:FixH family protein [Sphingomonadales bacterium]
MSGQSYPKAFTGRHMTAILVAFFAVVITVNFTMARLASSTFGGTVVDNSYVASQHYNEWLARAAAQERLGWERSVALDAERHVRLVVRQRDAVLTGLAVKATLSHPLGRVEPRALHFVPAADGSLRTTEAVPAGRWRLDLSIRRGADEARYRDALK